MIAVVTGASGFVGTNLVRRLRHDGYEVRCLRRMDVVAAPPPPGTSSHAVRYDDPRSLLECRALDGADVVFHLAAATRATRASDFTAANVTPARHLLGALVARRLAPRFVLVSSQAAAGPAAGLARPVTEEDAARPVEPYGASKLEAERVVRSFGDRVPFTIVRPSSVFGPHDRDFLTLFRFARRGVIVYPGVARHWFSVVSVDDAVDALIAASASPVAVGATYFVANAEPVQWREFGALIARAVARDVRHLDLPAGIIRAAAVAGELLGRVTRRATLASRSRYLLSRQRFWVCSASRARGELGFREPRSLPDAVRDTYLWYLDHGWLRASSGAAAAKR